MGVMLAGRSSQERVTQRKRFSRRNGQCPSPVEASARKPRVCYHRSLSRKSNPQIKRNFDRLSYNALGVERLQQNADREQERDRE